MRKLLSTFLMTAALFSTPALASFDLEDDEKDLVRCANQEASNTKDENYLDPREVWEKLPTLPRDIIVHILRLASIEPIAKPSIDVFAWTMPYYVYVFGDSPRWYRTDPETNEAKLVTLQSVWAKGFSDELLYSLSVDALRPGCIIRVFSNPKKSVDMDGGLQLSRFEGDLHYYSVLFKSEIKANSKSQRVFHSCGAELKSIAIAVPDPTSPDASVFNDLMLLAGNKDKHGRWPLWNPCAKRGSRYAYSVSLVPPVCKWLEDLRCQLGLKVELRMEHILVMLSIDYSSYSPPPTKKIDGVRADFRLLSRSWRTLIDRIGAMPAIKSSMIRNLRGQYSVLAKFPNLYTKAHLISILGFDPEVYKLHECCKKLLRPSSPEEEMRLLTEHYLQAGRPHGLLALLPDDFDEEEYMELNHESDWSVFPSLSKGIWHYVNHGYARGLPYRRSE